MCEPDPFLSEVMLEEAPPFLLGIKLARETMIRDGAPGMLIASIHQEYVGEVVWQLCEPEAWAQHVEKWGTRRRERYFGDDGTRVVFVHWLSVPQDYRRRGIGTMLLAAAMQRTGAEAISGIVGHRAFPKAAARVVDERSWKTVGHTMRGVLVDGEPYV